MSYKKTLFVDGNMIQGEPDAVRYVRDKLNRLEKAEELLNKLPQLYDLPTPAQLRIVEYFKNGNFNEKTND